MAGEGIPYFLWQGMREGEESLLDVGERRARGEGSFSFRHARVCLLEERLAAMCLAYRLPNHMDLQKLGDFPSVVRPLVELESQAPGSWYINAVATFEKYRARGAAKALLADAFQQAKQRGCSYCSLIVSSENKPAHALYCALGFDPLATLPSEPLPGKASFGEWLLMVRKITTH